ncbi:MAG: hypothetical protein AAFQ60_06630 [Pseudomonadota bacterium]
MVVTDAKGIVRDVNEAFLVMTDAARYLHCHLRPQWAPSAT